ncbi:MAG: transketolase, partial [Candidatus Paceibacterota bacterium]
DIFSALYFHILNNDPKNPEWPERDRLILSNGHICPIRYASMALAGYFDISELQTLRKFGSRLQGHPEKVKLPGLETTSGPLGLGLGQAAGIAYGAKMDGKNFKVFCVMSDGEQEEGNTWESAMFAGKNNLGNLIAIIDQNNIQISGKVNDVMPIEPLTEKYKAFGWNVLECDGNNIAEFLAVADSAKSSASNHPTVIIAQTVAGKGIKEIEGDYLWHGRVPTSQEAERFLREL